MYDYYHWYLKQSIPQEVTFYNTMGNNMSALFTRIKEKFPNNFDEKLVSMTLATYSMYSPDEFTDSMLSVIDGSTIVEYGKIYGNEINRLQYRILVANNNK